MPASKSARVPSSPAASVPTWRPKSTTATASGSLAPTSVSVLFRLAVVFLPGLIRAVAVCAS